MDGNTVTDELQFSMSELDISEENDSPSGERWDPVGANNGDDDFALEYKPSMGSKIDRLRELEEEQEMLNSSLIALTTHFAQVQFRLKQICDAPTSKKEELLKELEEFAFRGIPDIQGNLVFNKKSSSSNLSHRYDFTNAEDSETDLKTEIQKNKQKELICQLKTQLEELEKFAYETGDADLPQSVILERQNLIINHLKEKLNFNVEDFCKLSTDDLRWQVDYAINQIVSPLKMKEQLISQLKTQITDLERFINYLQEEVSPETLACTCACPVHTNGSAQSHTGRRSFTKPIEHKNQATNLNTVRKVVALLHIYLMSQMGCGSEKSQRIRKKDTMHGWRDLRTRLDIAVEHVLQTLAESEYCSSRDSLNEELAYNSDSDSNISQYNAKVTLAVRKHLAICIRDLMQHGTSTDANVNSVVPFVGCFTLRSYNSNNFMHAWEIILKYYEIKNGHRYNSTPVQKLSQSFNLDLNGGQTSSSKQNLLVTIGNIITTHSRYKRSLDANFKAFICAALNANKLVTWLKLILQCQYLLENYYMPWSYVVKTGFQDAFHTLDKLTKYKFDLPIDLAIQQFQNIKEAF
ncbi:RUN domain-containing protein 1 [Phymastichus coffea]|uniref:RUN domain-containing protein 1 n=1 Tax=Phymastichus coffea TaxID=108790 RepID=UPI00273C2FA7|nr:RUN domain-containing protein 1 [Phymastichus coffea]